MWLMQLGEVIFGGVGSGLYGMLVFAIVAVFVAGPHDRPHAGVPRQEDRGLRDEDGGGRRARCRRWSCSSARRSRCSSSPGRAGIANPGAHGFSEILYAFSSAGNNNGSAFAGLSANTPFYNTALGFAMLFSRYWLIVPVLAIAGSFAAKKTVPAGAGTLPTHGPLFVALLLGTVFIVGALTFVPALALGPVVEHLQMLSAK